MSKILDAKFYKKELRADRQRSYRVIVDYIMSLFPTTKSIIDYGCGGAWFLYYFKKNYPQITEILGIEPNANIKNYLDPLVKDSIITGSLAEYLHINRIFDLALCIEVAEHIEEQYVDTLLYNITVNAPVLIFSAATSGQGGYEHVNEQPFEYWTEKLSKFNFFCDQAKTIAMRKYLRTQKVNTWYYRNMSVFKSYNESTK